MEGVLFADLQGGGHADLSREVQYPDLGVCCCMISRPMQVFEGYTVYTGRYAVLRDKDHLHNNTVNSANFSVKISLPILLTSYVLALYLDIGQLLVKE